jgi:hypothetical protein
MAGLSTINSNPLTNDVTAVDGEYISNNNPSQMSTINKSNDQIEKCRLLKTEELNNAITASETSLIQSNVEDFLNDSMVYNKSDDVRNVENPEIEKSGTLLILLMN